jgi:nicotinamide riboside kinase
MPDPLIKIVLTGAESTGKSVLAEALGQRYKAPWVPELARAYIEKIGRYYTYHDLENIALEQIKQEQQFSQGWVFFDTWLIITKVWFDFVYGMHPQWLDSQIRNSSVDLFLLCDIDLPWIADPVRENGGENRERLHLIYQQELNHYGFRYVLINGVGEKRIENAVQAIEAFLKERI